MKITRRSFVLTLLSSGAVFLPAQLGAQQAAPAQTQYIAYVGTYTSKTTSKGIYAFRFDAQKGQLTSLGVAVETPDPSWVVIHPNGKFLYAANEAGKNSAVSSFAVDAQSGKLTLLNQLPALGEDPCYLSFDKTGKFLFVANYTSGNVVVFRIGADGKFGDATANVRDEGKTGPNKQRQEAPHAHWIEQSVGGSVYVADLGLDRVRSYGFNPSAGTLLPGPVRSSFSGRMVDFSAKLASGTGPRHAVFAKRGQDMYVLGELSSTVTAFHMVGFDDFVPTPFQTVSSLPKEFSSRNDAAEIVIHPSSKFLYTSNRGHDSIAIFAIDAKKGTLRPLGHVLTGGKTPRHFAIDPTGNFLLAENQESNSIVVFHIDSATGSLTPTGQTVDVPSPVCITFVAAE